jgi:hypothetical protein
MKLRIRGNSLCLRLLRGEVERFGKIGRVAETIQFGASPAARLSYILETDGEAREIAAHFADNQITVLVPEKAARSWIDSDEISLESEQSIENDASENVLKILIEKDFVCLDRKGDADNPDAFPHPTGKCG